MNAQLYKIKHDGEEWPKTGSIVHLDDDDDIVRGFISETTDEYCEVCTFEPIDVSDVENLIEIVAETLPQQTVLSKLQQLCSNDEEVRNMWQLLIREAQEDVNRT